MARLPDHIFIVDDDLCYGCGACIALCPVDALTLEGLLAIVDEPKCTHCELIRDYLFKEIRSVKTLDFLRKMIS